MVIHSKPGAQLRYRLLVGCALLAAAAAQAQPTFPFPLGFPFPVAPQPAPSNQGNAPAAAPVPAGVAKPAAAKTLTPAAVTAEVPQAASVNTQSAFPAGSSRLASLESSNAFDPDRKLWADRVPPPPPPPPPPAPAPVTEQDVQIYGIVMVGPTKRATVKLGNRFKQANPSNRAFITVAEGQALGEFVISEIRPNELVLTAQGTRQALGFTKKTDRSAPAAPVLQAAAPVQEANPTPTPAAGKVAPPSPMLPPSIPGLATPPAAGAAAPAPAAPVAAEAAVPAPTAAAASAETTDAAAAAAPPGSLAAAIFAAQAAARNRPAAPAFNPFLPNAGKP